MKDREVFVDSKALRMKLIEKDCTVRALAAKVGISEPSMYSKVNGNRDFSAGEIRDMAKALGLSGKELLSIFFAISED